MGLRAARDARVIVTPTQAVARQVTERLQPSCPVLAVPLGVTRRDPPTDAAQRRARLGIGRPYVLFVGTAEPRKGLDLLVTAMADPCLSHLDLVVVGPVGWGGVDVRDLAAGAGVADRVLAPGSLTDADLDACYAGARVVAVPSRAEGFGLPVVEAMAHGVPVVTSSDDALVEVGGGAAVAVASWDPAVFAAACADLAADGPERRDRVERGRVRAAEFTWERTAVAMWDVYRRAAAA
jgi:glycosyltransferase involved in cell wall biosynthesis